MRNFPASPGPSSGACSLSTKISVQAWERSKKKSGGTAALSECDLVRASYFTVTISTTGLLSIMTDASSREPAEFVGTHFAGVGVKHQGELFTRRDRLGGCQLHVDNRTLAEVVSRSAWCQKQSFTTGEDDLL
jgi:hypothetical protein